MNQPRNKHKHQGFAENTEENTVKADETAALDEMEGKATEDSQSGAMDELKTALEEQKAKYLRLYADFDNYKRRTAVERLELEQTAGKKVIIPLLDLLDDCDRAEKLLLSDEGKEDKPDEGKEDKHREGIILIFNKLRSILQAQGLKPMESLHTEFDVETQEAITQIPAPSEDLVGKVVDVIQKGYYLNDKIIRFAKVVIGN